MRPHQRQRLKAFIQRMQHGHARKHTPLALGPPDPQRHFTPERHNLTPEQCRLANQLLRKAEQERLLHGNTQQVRFRHALRCAGILSAVRNRLVGNSKFGHHLQGYRGGNVMKAHGMHILREIAPIGSLTARLNREKRQAQEIWERTGEVLAPGETPAHSPEEQRIQDLITLWETQQWQTQQAAHLRW